METIINQICENLKDELLEFFSKPQITLKLAEKELGRIVLKYIKTLLQEYIKSKDEEMRCDKVGRKAHKLTIVRRDDKRTIFTTLGQVEYSRTYYKNGTDGGYVYPIDEMLEVEPRERITENICEALVNKAVTRSYTKASEEITNGNVSKQTVMNKIRSFQVKKEKHEIKKRAFIHVDADEDHVHLQNGKNAIVPLISVYEEISHTGKRGKCENVFHISKYGLKPDELWEYALSEIEDKYDLNNTDVYLHGDGADWIKAGLNHLPNCTFVLDAHHMNKYLKLLRKGLPKKDGEELERKIREAIRNDDIDEFLSLQAEAVSRFPEAADNILKVTKYLYDNFEGCTIKYKDKNAINGATEPHVSHILSSRLSSRPMGWSENTLIAFAPMLAAKRFECEPFTEEVERKQLSTKPFLKVHQNKPIKNSSGLPDPDKMHSTAVEGHTGPLFNALRPYFGY